MPPSLLEAIAWGSVAECITSVGCPPRMHGSMDLTATGLNLAGPFLCGMAAAIDEEAIDAGADPGTRRRVAAFQVGFIGVSTSFSFMAEQAAWLGGLRAGALYILGITGDDLRRVSHWPRGARVSRCARDDCSRALRTGQLLPSSSRLLRMLSLLVALTWVWVLLAAGRRRLRATWRCGTARPPAVARWSMPVANSVSSSKTGCSGKSTMPAGKPAATTQQPEQADVLHLLVGLPMQGAGLALSARNDRMGGRCFARRGGETCSTPAVAAPAEPRRLCTGRRFCATVWHAQWRLALRMGEAARPVGGDDALLATKLRTSGCGALSVSGGLATLLITPSGDVAAAL